MMKRLMVFAACFLQLVLRAQVTEFSASHYDGRLFYLQNPYGADTTDFCIDSILVNDQLYPGAIRSSAFAVNIQSMGIKIGDPVRMLVYHANDCHPRLISPMHPKVSKVDFLSVRLSPDSILSWTCINEEDGVRPMMWIEKEDCFKWKTVDSLPQQWGDTNRYSRKMKFQPGDNHFRVRVVAGPSRYFTSRTAMQTIPVSGFSYVYIQEQRMIDFGSAFSWQIFSYRSSFYRKGESRSVDVSRFPPGVYQLCVAGQQFTFEIPEGTFKNQSRRKK